MSNLRNTITAMADRFVAQIIAAIRSASFEDIVGAEMAPKRGPGRPRKDVGATNGAGAGSMQTKKTGKGGRLARRSASDIEHVSGLIVDALKDSMAGLRSEQLQQVLKLGKREITGPLTAALKAKKITKRGQKRATTYHAK